MILTTYWYVDHSLYNSLEAADSVIYLKTSYLKHGALYTILYGLIFTV